MFHPRSLKVFLLVFLVIGSVSLQGCLPLVFLAANPIITAAIIATVPAIITMVSNSRINKEQMDVKRLEAETARANALSATAEKLNQQVVAQRQLELELIDKQTQTNDPAIKQQLANLQEKVAQDQTVISQTLNTANNASNTLANDKGTLPGITSGSSLPPVGSMTTGTPLTPAAPGNPTAPATSATGVTMPASSAPLTPDPSVTATGVPVTGSAAAGSTVAGATTGTPGIAPRSDSPAPVDTGTSASIPAGAVPSYALPNTPPVLGTAPAGAGL